MAEHADRVRGVTAVFAGVLLISFDALLVRLSAVDGWNVAFWRGLFMALALLLVGRLDPRKQTAGPAGSMFGLWLAAAMMAGSSLCLVLAFTLIPAANAVVILSVAPLFAALTSQVFLGERCAGYTWLAIAVCILGVFWVMAGSLAQGNLPGNGLAVLSTIFIGSYFTVFRRYPGVSRTAAILRSGLLLSLVTFPFATPLALPLPSYAWLLLAGLVQMPVALLLITSATRSLPAAEVSLFLLLETCFAPFWVWLVQGEVPPVTTLLGGMLIVTTLLLHTVFGMQGRGRAKLQ